MERPNVENALHEIPIGDGESIPAHPENVRRLARWIQHLESMLPARVVSGAHVPGRDCHPDLTCSICERGPVKTPAEMLARVEEKTATERLRSVVAHAVHTADDPPTCVACLSSGDDACPVMREWLANGPERSDT